MFGSVVFSWSNINKQERENKVNIVNTKKVVRQATIKKITPMLWGKAGIAKSEVVLEVAQDRAK